MPDEQLSFGWSESPESERGEQELLPRARALRERLATLARRGVYVGSRATEGQRPAVGLANRCLVHRTDVIAPGFTPHVPHCSPDPQVGFGYWLIHSGKVSHQGVKAR